MVQKRAFYSLFTLIIRFIAAVFNFSVRVVFVDRILDEEIGKNINNHGQNIGNARKPN